MVAFAIKTFPVITQHMIAELRSSQDKITDFNVGSVARTMLEAPASEIEEAYEMMAAGLIEAIPTAIYRSFDFPLEPARRASGVLRLASRNDRVQPVPVPVGVLFSTTGGQRFRTAEAVEIPPLGGSVEAVAAAVEEGPSGNVAAQTVTRLVSSLPGFGSVTNDHPFGNGRGMETEAERKARFQDYVKALARGTVHAQRHAAKLARRLDPRTGLPAERVMRAEVVEGPGHVRLYVHNGTGSTSPALVDLAQTIIDGWTDPDGIPVPGWRPAGMRLDVIAMAEQAVPVALRVQAAAPLRTDATKKKIRDAAGAAIRATRNHSRLLPSEILAAVFALEEVDGAGIDAPTLVTPCPPHKVLVPGEVAVTWVDEVA